MTTETNILEKARGLWANRGYTSVGIQEICQESGITKPTLYHYFKSKQGLLERVLESGYILLCPILEKEAAYKGDIQNALGSWSDNYMKFAGENRDFFRLALGLGFAPPESEEGLTAKPWSDRILFSLVTLFEAASADHGNMKGRAWSHALAFQGLMQTHGLMVINRNLSWTPDTARKTLHHFMHGIFS